MYIWLRIVCSFTHFGPMPPRTYGALRARPDPNCFQASLTGSNSEPFWGSIGGPENQIGKSADLSERRTGEATNNYSKNSSKTERE